MNSNIYLRDKNIKQNYFNNTNILSSELFIRLEDSSTKNDDRARKIFNSWLLRPVCLCRPEKELKRQQKLQARPNILTKKLRYP